jgi:hypothetical protein
MLVAAASCLLHASRGSTRTATLLRRGRIHIHILDAPPKRMPTSSATSRRRRGARCRSRRSIGVRREPCVKTNNRHHIFAQAVSQPRLEETEQLAQKDSEAQTTCGSRVGSRCRDAVNPSKSGTGQFGKSDSLPDTAAARCPTAPRSSCRRSGGTWRRPCRRPPRRGTRSSPAP